MGTFFASLPSSATGPSILPRNIFTTVQSIVYKDVPSMFIISGSLTRDTGQVAVSSTNTTSLLRAGLILGKSTTSGLYRNSIIGSVTTAVAASTAGALTTIIVSKGAAVEVQRLLTLTGANVTLTLTGPPGAAGVVAQQNFVATTVSTGTTGTTTGTLTITAASAPAFVAGSIIGPADGAATPVTVFCDNNFGIDVMDTLGNSIDQALQRMLIGGDLLTSMLINVTGADEWNSGTTIDTSVTAWIQGKLQANGKQFTFNTDR